MWLAQSMKRAVPTADADQGISTIVGDQMGVVTRGEVRQLPIYGPGGYVWLPESGASVLVIKGGPGGDRKIFISCHFNSLLYSLLQCIDGCRYP